MLRAAMEAVMEFVAIALFAGTILFFAALYLAYGNGIILP